jgi:hypothetical protein
MNQLISKTVMPFLIFVSLSVSQNSQALTGDAAVACEVILCLSTGNPPNQCNNSLKKFFSIKFRKPHKTIKARGNFLKLCPASDDNPEVGSLIDALSKGGGSGACRPSDLNRALLVKGNTEMGTPNYIRNVLPKFCSSYFNHEFTRIDDIPRYVGAPSRRGRWVDGAAYSKALALYKIRIIREDRQRRNDGGR